MGENQKDREDRRIQRTDQALIHALLELIDRKHYDQITVQDIVQRANVGRSTFYAHYRNKDELLMSGFEYLLDRLVGQIDFNADGQLEFDTALIFEHAHGHYEIYRTLIWGSGFELLIKDGHAVLNQKIEARLEVLQSNLHLLMIPLPIYSSSLAGGLLVLLKWWLDNKMPYTPKEMDAAFQQLVMPWARNVISAPGI
jgi:AcrR family transcriptional regulator